MPACLYHKPSTCASLHASSSPLTGHCTCSVLCGTKANTHPHSHCVRVSWRFGRLVVCVVGAMAGMVAGHRVHQYLSNAAVRVIILSLLSLAGCLLLGGGNLLRTVIAAAALIALVILFWALLSCTSRCCHPGAAKRRRQQQQRAVKPLPQP